MAMNSINLTGNICNDLELKQTNSGKSVISFNLAVKRPFSKDTTDFIPVVVYEQPAEYLSRYAHKGTKIAVSGKLTTRKYQDKNGNDRTAFEVVANNIQFVESKRDSAVSGGAPISEPPASYSNADANDFADLGDANDDDLPF